MADEILDQKGVWDAIAETWQRLRKNMYEDVEEFLKNREGPVLDLGCGSGRNFIAGKKYIGVDFSENMLRYAKEHAKKNGIGVGLIKADITRLPLKSGAFDTVLLVATLHVTEKREEVLKEMDRVMSNGGEAFLTVWNKMQPRFFLSKKETFLLWKANGGIYLRYYYLFVKGELMGLLSTRFTVKKIYGSTEKALKLFPKNIIAIVKKQKVSDKPFS